MEPVQKLKVGDVVMLKSGGPKMTVTVDESDDGVVRVAWFGETGIGATIFPVGALDVPGLLPLPGAINTGRCASSGAFKNRPTKEVISPTAKKAMS